MATVGLTQVGKTTLTTKFDAPSIELPTIKAQSASTAELGYTNEQFHADLKRASRKVKSMAAEARKDYREGKTEQFPEA